MLEDPRINFAISTRASKKGVDHLGIQVDEDSELADITHRLKNADLGVYGEGETTCCYAESKKAWVKDPAGVAWEAYRTMTDAELFNEESERDKMGSACCPTQDSSSQKTSCC